MAGWTRLQQELADRIVQMMRDQDLQPGDWLNENSTAKSLGVSRTPVRAAIAYLIDQGFVRRHPNRGIEVVALPAAADLDIPPDALEHAMVRMARDRHEGLIEDDISEQEVMRRYDLGRLEVQKLLTRFADLDMVERKPGYGWRFLQGPRDHSAHLEQYRFRLLIEPAAVLEPGFALNPAWAAEMRDRHRAFLDEPWTAASAIGLFEMNAAFHEGLAAASGNRYVHSAIKRQNQLRRLSNYNWAFGMERVRVNCEEHMRILDALEAGDRELAALLLRRHLEGAMQVKRKSNAP